MSTSERNSINNGGKYETLKELAKERYGGTFRFEGDAAKNWRERVMAAGGDDPTLCPYCKVRMALARVAYRARDGTGLKVVMINR